MAFTKEQEKHIMSKAQMAMYEKAQDAREKISKKYLDLIRFYYSEPVFNNMPKNEPVYYYRHFNNKYDDSSLRSSGLGHTFKSYFKHNVGKYETYTGGILIGDYNMYNDYIGRLPQNTIHNNIVYSFLRGWHGLPSELYNGIPSSIIPYDEMMKYRKELIQYYNK